MQNFRWILAALCLWLVFVVMQTPAAWAAYFMTKSGDLALTGVTGSFWQGRASMASIVIEKTTYSLGELRWKLKPISLLTLNPCAAISTDLERQQVTGTVCSGFSGKLTLTNANLNAPVSLAQAIAPNTKLDGKISLHLDELAVKENVISALKGNLSWTQARVHNGDTWLNVGSFAADLSATEEGHPQGNVFTIEGPIDLAGNITLPLTGGIFIKGDFSLTPEFSKEIYAEQWLPMIAEPLDNGRYKLDLSL